MMEDPYLRSFALFFALFNPFLMSIYLLDPIRGLPTQVFSRVLVRGSLISAIVFILFAWGGEAFSAITCKYASPPSRFSAASSSC